MIFLIFRQRGGFLSFNLESLVIAPSLFRCSFCPRHGRTADFAQSTFSRVKSFENGILPLGQVIRPLSFNQRQNFSFSCSRLRAGFRVFEVFQRDSFRNQRVKQSDARESERASRAWLETSVKHPRNASFVFMNFSWREIQISPFRPNSCALPVFQFASQASIQLMFTSDCCQEYYEHA